MNIGNRILIVSVYQANESHEKNKQNHEILKGYLTSIGIDLIEISGRYNGKNEDSFILHEAHRKVVEIIVRDYNQDCYLESHCDRYSELVFPDDTRQGLGYLVPINNVEASTLDSWSYRKDLNQYYAIRSQ